MYKLYNIRGVTMKLKTKIQLAFCVLSIVPLILVVGVLSVGTYKLKTIYNTYKIDMNTYTVMFNPMLAFNAVNSSIEDELEVVRDANPDLLCDPEYLDEYFNGLTNDATDIIVNLDGQYVYSSYNDNQEAELYAELAKMEKLGRLDGLQGGMYLGGSLQMLVNRVTFECSNGKEGRLYIVTHIEHIVPQVRNMVIIFLVCLAAILVAASGCISVWVYRGLVTPVRKLKEATHNIAEGNLDFTLQSNRHDEIGELINDFEVMRKRLRDSAEEKIQNDKESRELISNISHDLKTPMTAIKGYVEGIMDGIADTPEKMDRYVRTIYNKTVDMDKLINELTLYSKIDANKIPYNFNKINVAQYFEDCVSELKVELDSRNIELGYFNYADKSSVIIADPEQLKRVINNIISNSVKYMSSDRKGIINIRISDVDDFVQFEIEDNGKGIAQKDVQYIFDRFYRTDASRNSAQGGSGIGLSIVKKIISDHGGQIWATSKEGTGTVMHFVLRKYKNQESEHNE
jgi:signal transduction histidine kinase